MNSCSAPFNAVEEMFGRADPHVQDLASIGLYEGRDTAWLKRSRTFVGSRGRAWLTEYDQYWSDCTLANDEIPPSILDGYHVRAVVARELQLSTNEVPGTTYGKDG